jgi:integrase
MTERQIEKELNRQAVLFDEKCKYGHKTTAVKFEKFAEEWLTEVAPFQMKSTTYERIKLVRNRIYPAIGHMRLDKITTRDLQKLVNSFTKEGVNERTGGSLAPKTIRHYVTFISDVFNYAMRMDLVSNNPCNRLIFPTGEPKEKQIYTQKEIEKLFMRLQGEPLKYRAFFTLITYSGFRRSEMLGLEWKDIDFESGVISVRRTSNYTKAQGIYTDTTKTKRSRRSLKFPPYVMEILRDYKAEQDKEREELGNFWVDTDRLFVKWNGEPMNNQTPYGWLKEFCERVELPFYGLHSFRHFNASALINAGVDVTSVSSALGHSVPSTTMNIYSHVFDTVQTKVSDAITSSLDFSSRTNV